MASNCMLGRGPLHCRRFGYDSQCGHCGWNKEEAYRRSRYMKRAGLTKGKDNLWRLVLPKEWGAGD